MWLVPCSLDCERLRALSILEPLQLRSGVETLLMTLRAQLCPFLQYSPMPTLPLLYGDQLDDPRVSKVYLIILTN